MLRCTLNRKTFLRSRHRGPPSCLHELTAPPQQAIGPHAVSTHKSNLSNALDWLVENQTDHILGGAGLGGQSVERRRRSKERRARTRKKSKNRWKGEKNEEEGEHKTKGRSCFSKRYLFWDKNSEGVEDRRRRRRPEGGTGFRRRSDSLHYQAFSESKKLVKRETTEKGERVQVRGREPPYCNQEDLKPVYNLWLWCSRGNGENKWFGFHSTVVVSRLLCDVLHFLTSHSPKN